MDTIHEIGSPVPVLHLQVKRIQTYRKIAHDFIKENLWNILSKEICRQHMRGIWCTPATGLLLYLSYNKIESNE